MSIIKNRSAIGHLKERNELDIGQQITGSLACEVYELPTDGIEQHDYVINYPWALKGNIHKVPSDKKIVNGTLIPGQWYKVAAG